MQQAIRSNDDVPVNLTFTCRNRFVRENKRVFQIAVLCDFNIARTYNQDTLNVKKKGGRDSHQDNKCHFEPQPKYQRFDAFSSLPFYAYINVFAFISHNTLFTKNDITRLSTINVVITWQRNVNE